MLFQIPYNYGSALIDSGQYSRGFALLDRALTAATDTRSLGGMWHVLEDTAEWYRQQNDLERAGRYYERALEQAQAFDSRDPEGLTHVGMARLEIARGRLPEAERHCLEAMRLLTSAGHTTELPSVFLQLSRVHSASGNLAAAWTSIEQDIELCRRIGMSRELLLALIEIARIERRTGDAHGAAQHASEAVELVRTHGLRPLLPAALNELGHLALAQDDLTRAADLFEESVRAAEGLRPNMTGVEQQRAFDESSHAAYAGLLETRLRSWRRDPTEARAAEAFLVVERERAAPLIETIRSAARTGSGTALAQMNARIAQLQWKLSLPGVASPQRHGLVGELDEAERRREAIHAAVLDQPLAPKILDLRNLQWSLHPTEALLEYAASESSRVVFIVTRDRVSLADIGPDADASRTAFFTDLICRGKAAEALAAGSRLSQALLMPVFARLHSPARRLFIAAAGDLAALPFAALPYPPRSGTPLLRSFEIAYAPSLGTLAYVRRRHASAARVDLLALSNPTALRRMSQLDTAAAIDLRELPFSTQEINSISRYVSSRDVLSRSAATETALKARDLASYKIVHFATHAV
ncbi:MAG: CHAT domain-containing protein, partial [Thermoanaerobaculia bacterium]